MPRIDAYITGEPAAAELKANIRGLPSWIATEWSGTLQTERIEDSRATRDNRALVANVTDGAEAYDVKAALTNEVIGGHCRIRIGVTNALAEVYNVHIRGKNPLDADARNYIDANVDAEFLDFAWKIAKHESKQGNRICNQFNSGE